MRFTAMVTVVCFSITGISIADQARAAIRLPTSIGAQDLGPALRRFALERDVQVVYRSDLVRDRQTSGASGDLTVDEELTRLLSGTGLTFQYLEDNSVTIVPLADAQSSVPRTDRLRLARAESAPAATSVGSSDKEAADGAIEEIIVTAQKRAENAQSVPIPINTIDIRTLRNNAATINTTSLQQFVPGLVMGRSGAAGATFLRGVGTESGVAGTESPVATYLDGIYLGVNALGVFDLNNIAQISVLKGPQGTLFGRNTAGGAIQITTRDPRLDKAELSAEAGYGNYQTVSSRLYGSLPLLDTLAANLSVLYQNRGQGTVRNVFTGTDLQADETFAAQGKLLWQPTDRTQVKLNLIQTDGRDLPGLNYFIEKGALSQDGQTTYVGSHAVNLFTDAYQKTGSTIAALTAAHDFSWSRLSDTVSRTNFMSRSFNDQAMTTGLPNPGKIAPSNANLNADIDEWTEELQLQSLDGAPITWIGGLFYYDDRTNTSLRSFRYPAGVALPAFGLNTTLTTHSYAAYAQATREILAHTNLTAGLRYTSDEKGINGRTSFGQTVAPTLPPDKTFDKLTWRLAIDHHLTDNLMGYASYNRGFRSGTYSATSITNPPARPETLDAYELGFKSDLADRKVRLNVSGFYYDYRDLQIRVNVGSPVTALIQNAARAHMYGVDLDFEARLTSNLRLRAGMEGLHATYTSFPNGPGNYPVGVPQLGLDPITTAPPGCTGTPRTGVGGHSNNLECDLSGNDVINAPRFSASLGLEYSIPSRVGEWTLTLTDKYTGKSFASPDNFQVLDSYHFVAASAGWMSPSERYYARIWGTNLANSGRPAQMTFSLNSYEFLPNDPRFYGFTVGVRL